MSSGASATIGRVPAIVIGIGCGPTGLDAGGLGIHVGAAAHSQDACRGVTQRSRRDSHNLKSSHNMVALKAYQKT